MVGAAGFFAKCTELYVRVNKSQTYLQCVRSIPLQGLTIYADIQVIFETAKTKLTGRLCKAGVKIFAKFCKLTNIVSFSLTQR